MGYKNFGTGDPKLATKIKDLIVKGDITNLTKVVDDLCDTTERELVLLACGGDQMATDICNRLGFIWVGLK